MKISGVLLIGFWAAGAFVLLPGGASAAERERVFCGKNHRISIEDLDMSPDPVKRGERVQRWRIKVRVDGSGECETTFEIRERPGDEVVARGARRALRPGVNEITLQPAEGYRFQRSEHCFEVLADIERTRKPVDAAERFCAREAGPNARRWSLKERGDRPVGR
jgi:hypothetical protein